MNDGQPPKSKRVRPDKVVHLNAFKDIDSASDQAIEWLARIRSEDLQDGKLGAFAEWLAASSEHQRAFDEATALWHISGLAIDQAIDQAKDQSIYHTEDQLSLGTADPLDQTLVVPEQTAAETIEMQPNSRTGATGYRTWQPLAVAATFLLTCVVMLVQLQAPEFQTGKGEQRRIVLDDGSAVFLNTASHIEVHYTAEQRRIELIEGEAWFDVRKDPQRPFVVVGDFATATAVGTAFTVRDTPNFTRIAVTEGAVEVQTESPLAEYNHIDGVASDAANSPNSQGKSPHAAQNWLLDAEHGLVVGSEQSQRVQVDLAAEQAWQRGQLIYKEVTLAELIQDLNRYLPVTLSINDDALAQRKLTAVLQMDDHDAMLDALSQVLPVKWKAVSDNLVILTGA